MKRWADIAAGILLGVLLAGVALVLAAPPRGKPVALLPPPPTPTCQPLKVDVEGAVNHPGVYALPRGSRVQNAVDAAGGFAPNALREAVNLAAFLEDGVRVYVPAANQPTPAVVTPTVVALTTAQPSTSLIDINTATADELETLPRIGPALAGRIVAYRQAHGAFHTIDDLLAVKGIGPALLKTIQPYITVSSSP